MTIAILALIIALVAVLANQAVWARQPVWRRMAAVAIAPVIIGLAGFSVADSLSRPKPTGWEWRTGEAEVLAHRYDEGKAIYLWLVWPGESDPRAYVLPWREQTAQEIDEAMRGQEAEGGEIMAEFGAPGEPAETEDEEGEDGQPFEPSLETREIVVHHTPQPAAPTKLPVWAESGGGGHAPTQPYTATQ